LRGFYHGGVKIFFRVDHGGTILLAHEKYARDSLKRRAGCTARKIERGSLDVRAVYEPPMILVTDIEGTTTPITFVKDVLFPYAQKYLPDFVRIHAETPAVAGALAEVRAMLDNPNASLSECVDILDDQMRRDVKATPLKTLQGLVWEEGYRCGNFLAPIYADVLPLLERARAKNVPVYVYSSGSIAAQKLLFSYTDKGNLMEYFKDYFDTTSGLKTDASSYKRIAAVLGVVNLQDILFLSDSIAEVAAARDAGWKALQVFRDGLATSDGITSFEGVLV
jgi:enolase-phosphatase E1